MDFNTLNPAWPNCGKTILCDFLVTDETPCQWWIPPSPRFVCPFHSQFYTKNIMRFDIAIFFQAISQYLKSMPDAHWVPIPLLTCYNASGDRPNESHHQDDQRVKSAIFVAVQGPHGHQRCTRMHQEGWEQVPEKDLIPHLCVWCVWGEKIVEKNKIRDINR